MKWHKIVVGISGKKQAGKTTAAHAVNDWADMRFLAYDTLCFAIRLKQLVLDLFVPPNWALWVDNLEDDEVKNRMLPCGKTIRQVLQLVGTEKLRSIDDNVWINAWKNKVNNMAFDILTCPDVRFPNELETIQSQGGIVIRLTRMPCGVDDHPSETALDLVAISSECNESYKGQRFDYVIDNVPNTVEQTQAEIQKILIEKYPEMRRSAT